MAVDGITSLRPIPTANSRIIHFALSACKPLSPLLMYVVVTFLFPSLSLSLLLALLSLFFCLFVCFSTQELMSFVRSYVVPEGFPDSVTPSYVPYMTWRALKVTNSSSSFSLPISSIYNIIIGFSFSIFLVEQWAFSLLKHF
jgi:hypothetical protein